MKGLEGMVRLGIGAQGDICKALSAYGEHYRCERNDQGLHNKLIDPDEMVGHPGRAA